MIHPDTLKFAEASDDELRQLALDSLTQMDPQAIDEFVSGFPDPPGIPDLCALVSPDGVTVKVFRGDVDAMLVHVLVMRDVIQRYLRPVVRDLIEKGVSPSDFSSLAE